jgi:hypothetical protein
MSLGCGSIPGEGVFGRQCFCVREFFTPPGNEPADVATRSHPAIRQAGVRMTNKFLKPDVKPKGPFRRVLL